MMISVQQYCHLIVVLVCIMLTQVIGFPQYLIGTHCRVPMDTGTVMMGVEVVDSNKRVIKVNSSGSPVRSGDVIHSLDDVDVFIAPKTAHVAYEVTSTDSSVRFDGGHCTNKSRAWKLGTLEHVVASSPIETTVTIVATWGSGSAVFRSPPFTFTYSPPPRDNHQELL
jgi:hypothetical protein